LNCFVYRSRKIEVIVIVIVVIIIIVIAVVATVVAVVLKAKKGQTNPTVKPTDALPPPTGPPGADGPYRQAVVAADSGKCSEIGRDIMKRNGSAVDSAVAALFCTGVINMHSAGIGGGGFMLVYNRRNKSSEVFDFREEAPSNASVNMYVNSSLSSRIGESIFLTY
jgi:gamma-glutamyltranspeptidase/glutathione hydrolase/leukotriene-C4 hydrolase